MTGRPTDITGGKPSDQQYASRHNGDNTADESMSLWRSQSGSVNNSSHQWTEVSRRTFNQLNSRPAPGQPALPPTNIFGVTSATRRTIHRTLVSYHDAYTTYDSLATSSPACIATRSCGGSAKAPVLCEFSAYSATRFVVRKILKSRDVLFKI